MTLEIEPVRAAFRECRCRHVVLPALMPDAVTAPMRSQLATAHFESFYEPDRGRYESLRELEAVELFDELRILVEAIVERPLRVGPVQCARLRHRDYALIKDGAKTRLVADSHVEVTVDLSASATEQAEIVYTDGLRSWPVSQLPGSVAIVERDTWVHRYERYLDHRVADRLVYRLRIALL